MTLHIESHSNKHLSKEISFFSSFPWDPPSFVFLQIRRCLCSGRTTPCFNRGQVPFNRKAWGWRPKSHIILIEIKKEARYLKNSGQRSQKKTAKFKTDQIYMEYGFWDTNLELFRWTGLYNMLVHNDCLTNFWFRFFKIAKILNLFTNEGVGIAFQKYNILHLKWFQKISQLKRKSWFCLILELWALI